ncbi:hypothetical protein [Crossiella cryophila]|uniref:Uncharacterized protein n=1 Tax=Crossiella cryophila TaxID=43355 RepID=A0A7W7C9F0_9PSEU|nr:hypothetical protein [Crossiella cryophila]MBB4676946.1 hypothetical protein [Crossiella cryophila]
MSIRQKVAGYGAAVLAMVGALSVAAPLAAQAEINPCDLGVKLQELRGWDANDQYNIVVWKSTARESSHFNGIALQGHETAQECKGFFGNTVHIFWMVFKDGQFTRKGDGGYRNWAFSGRFERNDRHVKFLAR